MSQGVRFFKKNIFDLSESITVTATQVLPSAGDANASVAGFVQDRRNTTAWIAPLATTQALLTLTRDGQDRRTVDSVMLFNVTADIDSVILRDTVTSTTSALIASGTAQPGVTVTQSGDNYYIVPGSPFQADRIEIRLDQRSGSEAISVTQVIATEELGQLEGFPELRNNTFDRNLSNRQALSGRRVVSPNQGGYRFNLSVQVYNVANDLALLEDLYAASNGFLVWIAAGDGNQITNPLVGFKFDDVFLMQTTNNEQAVKFRGLYKAGYVTNVALAEVNR